MFFLCSARSPHRTTNPSWRWVRIGHAKRTSEFAAWEMRFKKVIKKKQSTTWRVEPPRTLFKHPRSSVLSFAVVALFRGISASDKKKRWVPTPNLKPTPAWLGGWMWSQRAVKNLFFFAPRPLLSASPGACSGVYWNGGVPVVCSRCNFKVRYA